MSHRNLKSIFYLSVFVMYMYLMIFIHNIQPDLIHQEKVQRSHSVSNSTVNITKNNVKGVIERILNETRDGIKRELRHYNWSKIGFKKLEDLLPEEGGKPFKVVIISLWRSGSTYVGYLLASLPGVIYYYEPLTHFNTQNLQSNGPKMYKLSTKQLKNLLKCERFDESYLEVADEDTVNMTVRRPYYYDSKMWSYCKEGVKVCSDPDFRQKFCKLFPFQIVKDVRVRLQYIEEIIMDKDLNVKIVVLVRDPRAIMKSRRNNYTKCKKVDPNCVKPEPICEEMVDDHAAARKLLLKYPRRIKVLRFEDLALSPLDSVRDLLQFLNLHMMEAAEEFLLTEGRLSNYTDYWVTQGEAFSWKGDMDFKRIEDIQEICQEAMDLWGYLPAYNWTHQRSDTFLPISNYEVNEQNLTLKRRLVKLL